MLVGRDPWKAPPDRWTLPLYSVLRGSRDLLHQGVQPKVIYALVYDMIVYRLQLSHKDLSFASYSIASMHGQTVGSFMSD